MRIIWLLLFGLLDLVRGCFPGCLVCGVGGRCKFCDVFSGLYLQGDVCVSTSIHGCAVLDLYGVCLNCEQSFYLDTITGTCVGISAEFLVPNCTVHSGFGVCSSCEGGFYVSSGACTVASDAPENCMTPDSFDPKKCLACKTGFLLAVDRGSCNLPPESPNCALFSPLECRGCAAGAVDDPAAFQKANFALDSAPGLGRTFRVLGLLIGGGVASSRRCVKTTVEHCVNFEAFNRCIECEVGYFLAGPTTCIAHPPPRLANCAAYATASTCRVCQARYFVSATGGCEAVVPVANCAAYDSGASTTSCVACESGFFLASGVCSARTAVLPNCKEPRFDADSCGVCASGYVLAQSGGCVEAVAFCATHKTPVGASAECELCERGYYLNTNQCIYAPIANCAKVAANQNCAECAQGYYLSAAGAGCIAHSPLSRCTHYSTTSADHCEACEAGFALLHLTAACIAAPAVPNCSEYGDGGCAKCFSGYLVNANVAGGCGLCVESASFPNCSALVNSRCTTCTSGFYLDGSWACQAIASYIAAGCRLFGAGGECVGCEDGRLLSVATNADVCATSAEVMTTTSCIRWRAGVCVECETGTFYESESGSCVTTCNAGVELVSLTIASGLVRRNDGPRCRASGLASSSNCAFALPANESPTGQSFCLACTASLPMFGTGQQGVTLPAVVRSGAADVSFFYRSPAVSCPYNFNRTISGCLLYTELTATTVGCLKCSAGLTGAAMAGYLADCSTPVTGCAAVGFVGLASSGARKLGSTETPLEVFTSCTKCTTGTPVMFLGKTANGYRYSVFNLTASTPSGASAPAAGVAQTCSALTAADLQLPGQPVLVAGCGIYVFLVDVAKSVDGSLKCAACSPGSAPTFSNGFVATCTAISNCKTAGTAFNTCGACADGFAWSFDAEGVDASSCREAPSGCAAARAVGDCAVCGQNATRRADGKCQWPTQSNCVGFADSETPVGASDMSIAIERAYKGHGCSGCGTGFARMSQSRRICRGEGTPPSPITASDSLTLPGCLSHGLADVGGQTVIVCSECRSGFVADAVGLSCFSADGLPNCIVASDETTCSQCKAGFVKIGSGCVAPATEHCEAAAKVNGAAVCVGCANGYYPDAGICKQGEIDYCEVFAAGGSCVKCLRGYVLLSLRDGAKYCFPIPAEMNCAVVNAVRLANSELLCDTCLPGYRLETRDRDQCTRFAASDSGCASYDFTGEFASSSLACLACEPGRYLDSTTKQCLARVRALGACLDVSPSVDSCITCETGYFVGPDGDCLPDPAGVAPRTITGCATPAADGGCAACQDGLALLSGECRTAQAQNCLTFASETACRTCPANLQLLNTNGVLNCGSASVGGSSCLRAAEESPHACVVCAAGFFASAAGVCQPVTAIIANCRVYANATACSACETGFALSPAATECVPASEIADDFDPECGDLLVASPYICAACEPGYLLAEGACTACPDPKTCFVCAPGDPPQCLICASGFYMTPQGTCLSSVQKIQDQYVPNPLSHPLVPTFTFLGLLLLLI